MSSLDDTLYRDPARWKNKNGSSGVWRADGSVTYRSGLYGPYVRLGHAERFDEALAMLEQREIGWRKTGGRMRVKERLYLRKTDRAVAGEGFGFSQSFTPNDFGLLMAVPATPTRGDRYGRVAALHLRVLRGVREILREPLTVGEVLAAVVDPLSPLNEDERRVALAEWTIPTEVSDDRRGLVAAEAGGWLADGELDGSVCD